MEHVNSLAWLHVLIIFDKKKEWLSIWSNNADTCKKLKFVIATQRFRYDAYDDDMDHSRMLICRIWR